MFKRPAISKTLLNLVHFKGIFNGLEHGLRESWNDGILVFQRMISILNIIVSPNSFYQPQGSMPGPILPIFQRVGDA